MSAVRIVVSILSCSSVAVEVNFPAVAVRHAFFIIPPLRRQAWII